MTQFHFDIIKVFISCLIFVTVQVHYGAVFCSAVTFPRTCFLRFETAVISSSPLSVPSCTFSFFLPLLLAPFLHLLPFLIQFNFVVIAPTTVVSRCCKVKTLHSHPYYTFNLCPTEKRFGGFICELLFCYVIIIM